MFLSRPVKFPLLKLPFLCIESVIKNWDIFDIIFFALFSKKTRRTVKHLKISLNEIRIFLTARKWIELDSYSRKWYFKSIGENESLFDEHQNLSKFPLVLQEDAIPFYTSKTDNALYSYSDENEVTALKMVMEFLNEVFKCSVEKVEIEECNLPESGNIGVKSTVTLCINQNSLPPFGYAQSRKLSLLLENLEVNDMCRFWMRNIPNGFYVDPKLFNCKQLFFSSSAIWVTKETIMQFEVPRLTFFGIPFSVNGIVSIISQWFHSDNKKLECLFILSLSKQISLENFQTGELNLVPFSGRTSVPPTFGMFDLSVGLEIVRHDGLVATIHVKRYDFLFYIWHDQ